MTKNDPGEFDCYAKAAPDEPMFILLGRDKHAPALVLMWAQLRAMEGEQPSKVLEAEKCAREMMRYRAAHCCRCVGVSHVNGCPDWRLPL